jgi:hypothetical protein
MKMLYGPAVCHLSLVASQFLPLVSLVYFVSLSLSISSSFSSPLSPPHPPHPFLCGLHDGWCAGLYVEAKQMDLSLDRDEEVIR